MTRYAVLLRGINVGGHKKVPMARLRDVVAASGLAHPTTLLASGNLLVSSDLDGAAVRAVAEKAIHEAFGFPVDTVVLTQEALAEVVSGHPFPDPAQTAIAFCAAPIGPESRARLIALATPAEEVVFSGQVAYLRFGEGQGTSKLAAGIPRALAPLVTTVRNLATSAKLARA